MNTLDQIKDLFTHMPEVMPLTDDELKLMDSRPFKALCMYLDWAKRGTEYRYDDLNTKIKSLRDKING